MEFELKNIKQTSKLKLIACAAACIAGTMLQPHAFAATISDIKVDGLQRVEMGTILAYLPIKTGQDLTPELSNQTIENLFNTGFFRDVKLQQNNQGVLEIKVLERSAIMQIDFLGMQRVSKDLIRDALRNVSLASGRFYDASLIEKAEQAIIQEYLKKGYLGSKVKTVVTPLEDNRVSIVFEVDEGTATRIKNIEITGNKAFGRTRLLDEMRQSPTGWFSWYTQANVYNEGLLKNDLETVRNLYLEKGYINFKFKDAQTTISDDKKRVDVRLDLDEGERFKFGNIVLSGNLLDKQAEIEKLIKIKANQDWYSVTAMATMNRAIVDLFAKYGYANVVLKPDVRTRTQAKTSNSDKEIEHFADINLNIEPGQRVYVRQINVQGNDKTRDEVIRREVRQMEQSWYDPDKLRLSEERLNRLGYFDNANIDVAPLKNNPDMVDVNVNVNERPTGQFNIGAGYSSTDKLVLQTSIKQDNVLGTGTSVGLDLNTSKSNRTIALSHVDPYVSVDGISRSTDVYYRTSKPLYSSGDEEFKIKTAGGSMRFGVPFSEFDNVYFGLGYENNKLELTPNSPNSYQDYVSKVGKSTNSLPITIGWGRDSRDSSVIPNKGRYQQASLELGLPIDNVKYYRLSYQHQYYLPLSRYFTVAFNTELVYGQGYSGKPYPVFKNLFAGGIGSVRGYDTSSLGPRDSKGQIEGGSTKIVQNMEVILPLPGTGIDKTLRVFAFVDAGNVYKEGFKNIKLSGENGLRYSYGLGISWISPIGPLKIGVGYPIKKRAGDVPQRFQFQIGTAF